jgi:hypothetical protein
MSAIRDLPCKDASSPCPAIDFSLLHHLGRKSVISLRHDDFQLEIRRAVPAFSEILPAKCEIAGKDDGRIAETMKPALSRSEGIERWLRRQSVSDRSPTQIPC